jgi:hypothetical protein
MNIFGFPNTLSVSAQNVDLLDQRLGKLQTTTSSRNNNLQIYSY